MIYVVRDIERAVCQRFHLTPEQLRGRDRHRTLARPRQIAMYLARELTSASLPRIGAHFHRDHTTVLHAKRAITRLLGQGGRMPDYIAEIREILATLQPTRERIAVAMAQTMRDKHETQDES